MTFVKENQKHTGLWSTS